MNPDLWHDIHNLRLDIFACRDQGRLTVEFSDRFSIEDPMDHANQVADGLAHLLNFRGLGAHWTKLNRLDAMQVTINCLHRDLVTGRSIVAPADAQHLAERLMGLFPSETIFLSNIGTDLPLQNHTRWNPVTDSTYNAGIVCVSRALAGMLWVEDRER